MNITLLHNSIGLRNKTVHKFIVAYRLLAILCELNSAAVEVYVVTL